MSIRGYKCPLEGYSLWGLGILWNILFILLA
jgi:hypothetical protein